MINKSLARKYAFQFLYHFQLPEFAGYRKQLEEVPPSEYGDVIDEGLNLFDQSLLDRDEENDSNPLSLEEKNYASQLILGVLENEEQLKKEIEKKLDKTSLERVENVELTVLLLGLFEMSSIDSVPKKVSLSEAIQLAGEFGTENSSSFVNGVLDKFL